jgi:hypothetical protein
VTRRDAAPGRVLQLSLLAWGLGHLALGRTETGLTWLAAEVAAIALVAGSIVWLAEGTYYLVPFLLGSSFVVVWGWQAVSAHRGAQRAQQAVGPAPPHSPAGAIVWLALPLLVWGTAFWLLAAGASSPSAVLDRFVAGWQQNGPAPASWSERLAVDPVALERDAALALERLDDRCRQLGDECDPASLLRDVRIRLVDRSASGVTAAAEMVRYERRSTRPLGLFDGSELVPVPIERVLTLQLDTLPEPGPLGIDIGARRWIIAASEAAAQAP